MYTSDHIRELMAPPKHNDDVTASTVRRDEPIRAHEYIQELRWRPICICKRQCWYHGQHGRDKASKMELGRWVSYWFQDGTMLLEIFEVSFLQSAFGDFFTSLDASQKNSTLRCVRENVLFRRFCPRDSVTVTGVLLA